MGVLLALLSPPSARAEGSEEVQAYFISINRLYEDLEHERALGQISRARRLVSHMEDEVLLSLYEGIILADLGRMQEATSAFKAGLFLQPEAKLPLLVSPTVEKLFEAVRQEVKKELAAMPASGEARLQEDATPRAALTPEATPAVSSGLRARALVPAIAGGVLLAAGGVSLGLAHGERARLRGNASGLDTLEAVQQSVSRGKLYQSLGFGLVGAGVVGLGVAAGLYVVGAPAEPLALGVGTDGTSAFVYGRWP